MRATRKLRPARSPRVSDPCALDSTPTHGAAHGGDGDARQRRPPVGDEIVLDSKGLEIQAVTDAASAAACARARAERAVRGRRRHPHRHAPAVRIRSVSGPTGAALQWLPGQTREAASHLFSQASSILKRTWIPTRQPRHRQTWEPGSTRRALKVDVGERLTPKASRRERPPRYASPMVHPVAPYLIAIAGRRSPSGARPAHASGPKPAMLDAARARSPTPSDGGAAERRTALIAGAATTVVLTPTFPSAHGDPTSPSAPTSRGDRLVGLVGRVAHVSGNLVTTRPGSKAA